MRPQFTLQRTIHPSDDIPVSRLPIDEDDVAFIFEDLHRGRSVVPPHNVPSRPVLLRWDIECPLTLENCVVMDTPEADKHVKEGRGIWGEETRKVVEERQKEIKRWREWVL